MTTATSGASALLNLLFEDALIGRCLVAPDGTVVRANAEWLRSTGYAREDVLGADIIDLFPDTRDMALALHARARAGHSVKVPRHAQRLGGVDTWWEGAIDPVPMDGGTGLLITTREVGAGHPAPRDATRSEVTPDLVTAVMDTVANLVVVFDREGRIVRFNRACEHATGYRAGEVVGETVFDAFIPAEERASVKGVFDSLRAGDYPNRHRNHWRTRDGSARLLDWVNTCVADEWGEVRYVIGTATDVTDRVLSERALHESEEKASRRSEELAAVLDAVPAAVFIARDRLGHHMDANRFCTELLRAPPGSNVSLNADNPERPRAFRAMRGGAEIPPEALPVHLAAARGAEIRDYDFELVFEDGEVRHLLGNARPMLSATGTPLGAVGAFLDITPRKRAEEALRRSVEQQERQVRVFEGIASTTPDFVYLFDLQGRFLYANRRLLEVWGMQLPDVIGKTCRELGYEPWHHDMHMREIALVIETRRPIKGEVPFRAPRTGTFGVYEYIFTPVLGPDGAVETIAGTTRDITERKNAEEALREADRRKSEFLAVLAHELRNPLAPLRNSIYLLEHAATSDEQSGHAKQVIRRQTEHLARLVDDLLDVTRISRGKIELQRARIDLCDVIRETADDLRSVFAAAQVALRLGALAGPVWIDADRVRVAQILGNLLHNAVKFTPAGGQVTVQLDLRDTVAELRVRDTGVGMDPETVEQMFDPFVQGARRPPATTTGGLGLGLALVKGLVELHGGSVRARSEGAGRGAEFLVQLPLAAASGAIAEAGAQPSPGAGRRILIIEDNVDAAQSLADILELHGHTVRLAHTGRSGVALARELKPEVILCDIGLPDLGGLEVARAIREDGTLGATRLVALSGYAQPEDRARARAAGFDAHLAKPADLDELMGLFDAQR